MNIEMNELATDLLQISLSGRMDMQGIEWIKKQFDEAVSGSSGSVLVDMSGVDYMSSIGIRSLLINAKVVTKRGKSYGIVAPQPDVRNVLEVSGIDQIIPIYVDLDAAKAAIS